MFFTKNLFFTFGLILASAASILGTKCGHPAVPLNARVTLSQPDLEPGTTVSYTCDPGYELFGSSTITCSAQGSWQGDLPFCGTNVAFRKPANQSTSARGGAAGNANDGETTTVHDGKQCTETLKETSPWWQVDLLRPYPIRVVRVTTRGCCGHQPLQDIEIRVGNSSFDLQKNPLCAWFPGTIEEGVTKTFTCARALIGQHVFLQLVGVEGSLSLCEVEVFTTEEFSPDRCAPPGSSADADLSAFDRTCYEFAVTRGGSFDVARKHCTGHGGDLIHGLRGPSNTFLLAELERRKPKLKTQLVWIGAQKEEGFTSRTWKWVDGQVVQKPSWGKDQPNNYNGEQNCAVLDGGRNWLWNDVGCNLDYLHWVCQHRPSSCGSPDKLQNTTIEGDDRRLGSSIQYRCPEGHMLVGSGNRTCKEGFWTGMAPSCKYVDCGGLPDVDHGTVTLESSRTTHGAVAVYACHENYTLIGKERRTCGDGGIWSEQTPQCLLDWCPDPPKVNGGTVEVSGKRAGSVASYTCQSGFILFGTPVLSCGLGGEWSGKAPTCKFVDCGAPPGIDHGEYNLMNASTAYGSVVEYSCKEDYWLDGQRRQTCTKEGKWSADAPSCELITCEEPDVPAGSYVVGYDFNVHSNIEYHCEVGHILRGEAVHTCDSNGHWTGISPKCEYIDCGKVPPIPYGAVSYVNGTTHLGSELTYSCVKNFRLNGVASRVCQENEQWSDSTPKCEEVRCPEPVLAEHSILSVTGNDRLYGRTLIRTSDSEKSYNTYKIGALVKYRCERGYKIIGESLSTCEDTGTWSGGVPQCVYVECGTPTEKFDNGRYFLASNASYYGAALHYECNPNFELDGHARRLCLENGTWSSEPPLCKEIQCGEPEKIEGISIKMASRSVGGIATYVCDTGRNMEGNATRVCLAKGTWSGKVPKCTAVDCGHPGQLENGRVIVVNDSTTYNSAAEYHCIPQYERIGPYLRKCMEDGTWSGEAPRCQLAAGDAQASQTVPLAVGVSAGVVIVLLIILGLIYLRLRKEKPVKNTENIEGAVRKEEQTAAVMSYATLSDRNGYGSRPNMYAGDGTEGVYDAPYEEAPRSLSSGGGSHYEPSPVGARTGGAISLSMGCLFDNTKEM